MKKYIITFISIFIVFMALSIGTVAYIDPFFHYHKPVSSLYYRLSDSRHQNDGVARQFEYDAIITGTSLVETIKPSIFNEEFGTNAIKIPYPGATFYETARTIRTSYATGHDLKLVFRSFDMNHLVEEAYAGRTDLGVYPEYLYNDTIRDDYKYLCNIDVLHDYCIPMILDRIKGKEGGVTSFDDYMYTERTSGDVLADISHFGFSDETIEFTSEDKRKVNENVEENIISLAKEHPETTFIYFIPPYSVAWWNGYAVRGEYDYITTAMQYAVEMMLEVDNIKVYMLANEFDITTDLSNYEDAIHYVNDINFQIMDKIKAGDNLLTKGNYEQQFAAMYDYYRNYDYGILEAQAGQQ